LLPGGRALAQLLLVPVGPQFLLPLVGGNLVSLSFFPAGHSAYSFRCGIMRGLLRRAIARIAAPRNYPRSACMPDGHSLCVFQGSWSRAPGNERFDLRPDLGRQVRSHPLNTRHGPEKSKLTLGVPARGPRNELPYVSHRLA